MTQTLFNGAYHIKTNIAADYITLEAGRQKIRQGGGDTSEHKSHFMMSYRWNQCVCVCVLGGGITERKILILRSADTFLFTATPQ